MTKSSGAPPKQRHSRSALDPGTSSAFRQFSRRQTLLLPLISTLIFFLLLEGGLALFGVIPVLRTEDPFVGFAANVPLFVPVPDSGSSQQMITAPNRLTFFNSQSFPKEKPQNTYRIFCLGGSTTYGRPYSDTTSFAGWLRELLPVADGHKQWEVINAGGISYASYRVAHLMEELVRYQPDLFVIYTGHNEFLEERTYGKLRDVPESIRSTVALLARTRTWAAMDTALKGLGIKPKTERGGREQLAGEVNTILARSAGPERYTRDDSLQENILQHYRISLERMTALARSVDAEIIFVTPASNLKDCSPFKSEHTAGLDPSTRQHSKQLLVNAKAAIDRKDTNGALELLDRALVLDPRHAELLYRRGKMLLSEGQFKEAEILLNKARDEDVCPLRALSPMRQVVTDVALNQGAALVDFIELLQRQMQNTKNHPISGEEYFFDHVHPTIEGHKILAVALVQSMIDRGMLSPDPAWGEQAISAVASRIESEIDQEAHGQALANLARVLNWAGKTEDAERLATQALSIGSEHPKVVSNAASTLASVYRRQGQPERALDALFAAIKEEPRNSEIRFNLGLALLSPPFRQREKAAAHILLACKQLPDNDLAHMTFALAMAERGRLEVGYPSLLEALRLNPKNSEAEAALVRMRQVLGVTLPNSQMPEVLLETYLSGYPRKLMQVRSDSSGRIFRDGIEAVWYENGRLKRLQDLEKGVLDGFEFTWDKEGKLLSRIQFKQGQRVML